MLDFIIAQQHIFRNILDIILVFLILRGLFRIMRGTKGIYFMNGIIILFIIYAGSRYLKLTLFSQLLDQLMLMLMVALPIIFQSELKRGLEMLGRKNPLVRWFIKAPEIAAESIEVVAEAAENMAKRKIGALIVFERGSSLASVSQSGSYIDAVLSKIMI